MLITLEEALPAYAEARHVKEAVDLYCVEADKVPVSLDDLTFAVTELTGFSIETKTIPFNDDLIRGVVRIWSATDQQPRRAQIIVDADLNLAWTRAVYAKELSHVVLHRPENCTSDPTVIIETHLDDLLVEAQAPVQNGERRDFKNEGIAMLVALEFLFPFPLRDAAKARIAAEQDTLFSIAEWLKIPQNWVAHALSDRHLGFVRAVRQNLNWT